MIKLPFSSTESNGYNSWSIDSMAAGASNHIMLLDFAIYCELCSGFYNGILLWILLYRNYHQIFNNHFFNRYLV